MVNKLGVQVNNKLGATSFKANSAEKTEKVAHKDTLLVNEKFPALTNLKNKADKFSKSFTTYPKKGLMGSKNANFYEFLSMGTVPYLVGSATMIGVFNFANRLFDTPAMKQASKLGRRMGMGVLLYGLAKTISKKFIETPVKARFGIDSNMPYQKIVYELPEESNKNDLVKHESHKVFESVDFPRWDLLYDNEKFGENRNAYFDKIAKKMGFGDNVSHSDQKVKPLIRQKIVQTKLFSTLSSYLWAATAVAVATNSDWESLGLNLKAQLSNNAFKDSCKKLFANKKVNLGMTKQVLKDGKVAIKDTASNYFSKEFIKGFGDDFVNACKKFVTNPSKTHKIAGIALLGTAIASTLIGNFVTLFNVNKDKGETTASTPIFNPNKEKVVC